MKIQIFFVSKGKKRVEQELRRCRTFIMFQFSFNNMLAEYEKKYWNFFALCFCTGCYDLLSCSLTSSVRGLAEPI